MWMMEWEEMVVENWNDVAKGGVTPPIQGIREARAHSGKEPHGARPTAAPSWAVALALLRLWLVCCPTPQSGRYVARRRCRRPAAGTSSRPEQVGRLQLAGARRPHWRDTETASENGPVLSRARTATAWYMRADLLQAQVRLPQPSSHQPEGRGQQTFHRISQVPLVPHLSPWGPSCCTVCFSGVSLSPEVQARCFN